MTEETEIMHDAAEDKNLKLVESELRFISRHVQAVRTDDFGAVDEIGMAVESALRALFEYKLSVQPDTAEEIPAGVAYPTAA
jgi:hypothetical protein